MIEKLKRLLGLKKRDLESRDLESILSSLEKVEELRKKIRNRYIPKSEINRELGDVKVKGENVLGTIVEDFPRLDAKKGVDDYLTSLNSNLKGFKDAYESALDTYLISEGLKNLLPELRGISDPVERAEIRKKCLDKVKLREMRELHCREEAEEMKTLTLEGTKEGVSNFYGGILSKHREALKEINTTLDDIEKKDNLIEDWILWNHVQIHRIWKEMQWYKEELS